MLLHHTAFSQKEWSNWYYNGRTMLTFKNGYPENVTNFITNPPPLPPSINRYHFYYNGQGGISYSNPVTGATRFIISNLLGYSNDFNYFPSGTFLRSCPDQQSYQIIPFVNDPDKFYIIQFQSCMADLIAAETGLQVRCPNAIGLGYSILDMRLNGGRGEWVSVNNVLNANVTEQITMVKHQNGRDTWIIVHPYFSSTYKAFLLTDGGVQNVITSNIGVMINGGSSTANGNLTASHDGKMLAGSRSISPSGSNRGVIELFDFNNQTGELSNYRLLSTQGYVQKLTFSPDNCKLYGIGFNDDISKNILTQWDFNAANVQSSKTLLYTFPSSVYDMHLAPDAKIYVNYYEETDSNFVSRYYLPVIQCPNLPKYACNFILKGFQTPGGAAFPLLINDYINQPPAVPTPNFSLGNDTTICFGSLTISAPPGWQSYRWNTGDTSRTITVRRSGIYHVLTGVSGFSCPDAFGYIKVSDAALKLNLGRDTLLCPDASYQLHIPDQYSNIFWSNGSSVRDSIIRTSSNITIQAKDINGCSTSDTINILFKQYPSASFGPDTIVCYGQSLLLRMLPMRNSFVNAIYTWQNNSTLDTFRVTQSGTYSGRVSYQGCTASDTINVQYINPQTFRLPNDTTVCSGDSILINAPVNNAVYLWNTGATTQSIKVFTTGNYSVRVSNYLCFAWDTIHVTFTAKPVFSLGNDTTVCEGTNLILQSGLSVGNYLWQDGSVQPNYTVNAAGVYILNVNLNGCSVSDSIRVNYLNNPVFSLGNDTSFCEGATLLLQVTNTNIQQYIWQNSSSMSQFPVTSGGTYFVNVTDNNGCKYGDTINIQVFPVPEFSLGNDTSLCAGKEIRLSCSITPASFLWNNGNVNNFIVVNQPGLYWLKVSRLACSFTDSIIVNYNPVPDVNLGSDTTLCNHAVLQLNVANPNSNYVWQNGSTSSSYTVNSPGTYFVTTVNQYACSNADTVVIRFLQTPVVTLGNDTFICPANTFLLTALVNTEVDFNWQDGSHSASFNVSDTGIFTVTVNNICGIAQQTIVVRKGLCQLQIPNSFSPNDDLLNDVFRMRYPYAIENFQMIIYNRFGQKIFTSYNITKGWDGKFTGRPQTRGVYVWMISFRDIDGETKTLKGTVYLYR